jgi:tetrapyrrole methylase family protein/MazG family protein
MMAESAAQPGAQARRPKVNSGVYPGVHQSTTAAIRIVGLGPGEVGDLTLAAWQALTGAAHIVARTGEHPCLEALGELLRAQGAGGAMETCDDLYEEHATFAEVYAAIVERVIARAAATAQMPGGVVYAVPGHPWVGEATTPMLLARAHTLGLEVEVVGSMSFVTPAFSAMGIDLMDGGQVVDAMLLGLEHHPNVEVGLPLLVGQVYSRQVASDVKLTLLNAYPDEHIVTLVQAAGTSRQHLRTLALYEMDQGDHFDHLTTLYVPALRQASFTDLQEIIAHLRAPEGCPWDQAQTLETLRQDLLGEVVEVLEAIDLEADGSDNRVHIAEELGDLYLVATMMVQIATEEGSFRMADVMQAIVTKLIRRHPHVFGDLAVDSVDELIRNWDAIKAEEKAEKGQEVGPLDGVPVDLPALAKAQKLQAKAAKAGLLDRQALAAQNAPLAALVATDPTEAHLGALLWQLVALAHAYGINAEDALRAQTVAFRHAHTPAT